MVIYFKNTTTNAEEAAWVVLPDRHPVHHPATSSVTMKYDAQADPQVLTFARPATGKTSVPMPVNGLLSQSAVAIFNNVGRCSQFTVHLNWPYTATYTNTLKKLIDERITYNHTYPAEILQKPDPELKLIRVDEKDPVLGNWYGDWSNTHPGLGIYIVWKTYETSTAKHKLSLIDISNKDDDFEGGKQVYTQWSYVMIVREHCVERYTPVQSPPVLESPFNSIGPTPKCANQDRIARYSSIPGNYASDMSPYR